MGLDRVQLAKYLDYLVGNLGNEYLRNLILYSTLLVRQIPCHQLQPHNSNYHLLFHLHTFHLLLT